MTHQPASQPSMVICFTKCWACAAEDHYDPPVWHSWADPEDVEHALATGQPDPRSARCACSCADADKPAKAG